MAYVTDTTADPQAAYVKKIAGVDLLVHECYYPDAHADLAAKYGHSSLSAVAEVARAAGVGKLILTHIDPLQHGGRKSGPRRRTADLSANLLGGRSAGSGFLSDDGGLAITPIKC